VTRLIEQIETALPPEAAFAFVADFANAMALGPGRRHLGADRRRSRSGLAPATGSACGSAGRVAPMEYRITVFEPSRRVVLAGEGSGVSAVDEISLRASRAGTRIDYTADIRAGRRAAPVAAIPGWPVRPDRTTRPWPGAATGWTRAPLVWTAPVVTS
jgi:carbon monoxide dehydrogenase subunit G